MEGSSGDHPTKYFIRPMHDEDIPQVLDIDHEAFATQWPPVSYSSLKQELRNRMAHYVVLCTHDPHPLAWSRPDVPVEVIPPKITETPSNGVWRQIKGFFQRPSEPAPVTVTTPSRTETIIGFAGIWKMYDEVHIIAIAVRQCFRTLGCGERLLIQILEMAISLGARVVTLEVRVSNRVAQSLYVKYGFRTAGVRHAYYSDNNEDALIMTTDPLTTDGFKAFFRNLKAAHEARWPELYLPAG